MPPRRRHEEQDFQIGVVGFLKVALPRDAVFWHHPAGGVRSKAEAGILKAMGAIPGLPDIFILWNGSIYGIELKKLKRGSLSQNQKDAHVSLLLAGCPVRVCKTLDEVEESLGVFGIPIRASLSAKRNPASFETTYGTP